MVRSLTRSIGLSLLCIIGSAAHATEPAPAHVNDQAQATALQSAHDFVQGFYDWYAAEVKKNNGNWAVDSALKNKRWPLSETIVSALTADREAQDKVPDYIVGIDFDPFLDAQDDCTPYAAGKVTETKGRYQVEVFDSRITCHDPYPELPSVIAVVEKRKGAWIFVNFIYPEAKTDLLSNLQALKEDREEHPH